MPENPTSGASFPLPEITLRKTQAMIPVSNRLLNDMGGDYPEEPLSPEFLRRYRREKRRQAVADGLVMPLWWFGDTANWLGVEITNVLYRLLGVHARMVHDSAEADAEAEDD